MKNEISTDERTHLLDIARKSILHYMRTGKPWIPQEPQNKNLLCKKATFVTLHKRGELRGCVGTLIASDPLYLSVASNAVAAAFGDPRFNPLMPHELEEIEIDISVLSEPQKMEYSGVEDLLKRLKPHKHGVILKKGDMYATFLPQVWEELPEKEEFLSHLCLKAGLQADEWKKGELEVFTYNAEVITK